MKVTFDKSIADATFNAVRQVLLTKSTEARPIAFKVGDMSNVLRTSDVVEEDMTEFISNVSAGAYECSGDFAVYETQVDGTLNLSKLAESSIKSVGDDIAVLHSLQPIGVQIFFRNDCGSYTSKENAYWLESKGVDTTSLVVTASHHCAIDSFMYTKDEGESNRVTFDLSLGTKYSKTEIELFTEAVDYIRSELSEY